MELVAQSFLACVFSKYKHKPGGSFREVAFSLTQGIGEVGQRGREEGWNLGGLDFESLSIGKSFCHFGTPKLLKTGFLEDLETTVFPLCGQ